MPARCGLMHSVALPALLAAASVAAACAQAPSAALSEDDAMALQRGRMVEQDIAARGVADQRVLRAMREVPRHRFVDPQHAPQAYADHPLPIAGGQTISQPYIVAHMTELARPRPDDRALEVGTGSGYQAAVGTGPLRADDRRGPYWALTTSRRGSVMSSMA